MKMLLAIHNYTVIIVEFDLIMFIDNVLTLSLQITSLNKTHCYGWSSRSDLEMLENIEPIFSRYLLMYNWLNEHLFNTKIVFEDLL